MPAAATTPMATVDRDAIDRLLASREPAVRALTHRDLLGRRSRKDEAAILDGPAVRSLLAGQRPDGGFGGHPYNKWVGAHWRLVSLVELGIPPREPRAIAALDTVLAWLTGSGHVRGVPVIAGLARRCGSQEGNALAVASRLGQAGDPRVEQLATALIGWQARRRLELRSPPRGASVLLQRDAGADGGLHEYATASGSTDAAHAADRAAELFLEHRLFRALATGERINDEWLTPHWPPYWHYESLQALVILARMGRGTDPRAADAIEELEARRDAHGRWHGSRRWWKPPMPDGRRAAEAIDWSEDDLGDRITTLRALTVLRARDALPGKRQTTLVPSPGRLWSSTDPPWAVTRSRTIARPSPAPVESGERQNRSKAWAAASASIPSPVSVTVNDRSDPSRATATATRPSGGRMAERIRHEIPDDLANPQRVHLELSDVGGILDFEATPPDSACGAKAATTSVASAPRSVGSRWRTSAPGIGGREGAQVLDELLHSCVSARTRSRWAWSAG